MSAPDLNRALERLDPSLHSLVSAAGHLLQGPCWAVGGFVRDLLLGRTPYDLDLAVGGDPGLAARALAEAFGGHAFPLGEEHSTFRVALPEGSAVAAIDIVALRGGSIEADLSERDFTLNAIAAPLSAAGLGALIDPFGARADIGARRVRIVSEAALVSDPLRLLRAARLAVELGFEVAPETIDAVRRHAHRLPESAPERLRDELMRILGSDRAARGLRLLDRLALLDVLLPELSAARGVGQPERYHHYDVFDHCLESVAVMDWLTGERLPEGRRQRQLRDAYKEMMAPFGLASYFREAAGGQSRLVLTKLAALLHDVGKPQTKTREADGRVRFLGHSEAGAQLGRAVCRRLRLGNKETHFVTRLIEEHLRPAQLSQSGAPTDRAVFRFFRDLGEAAPACLVLSLADAAAAAGPRLTLARWRAQLAYIAYVFSRAAAQEHAAVGAGRRGKRHFVSGDRLIRALEIAPGPEVGRLLDALDEAAATGEVKSEEEAIELARRLYENRPPGERAGRAGTA